MSKTPAERLALREKYRIALNNPFRNAVIEDIAIVRFQAARSYMGNHTLFTPRSLIVPAVVFGLIVAGQIYTNRLNAEKERRIQSGESTYFERALYRTKLSF
jgi:hypothetical protein